MRRYQEPILSSIRSWGQNGPQQLRTSAVAVMADCCSSSGERWLSIRPSRRPAELRGHVTGQFPGLECTPPSEFATPSGAEAMSWIDLCLIMPKTITINYVSAGCIFVWTFINYSTRVLFPSPAFCFQDCTQFLCGSCVPQSKHACWPERVARVSSRE